MERPEGSSDMPPGFTPMPKSEGSEQPSASSSSKPASTPAPASKATPAAKEEKPVAAAEEPADEPMEVDSDEQAKKEAGDEKAKGNAAYKSRKFDEAIQHYSKAWELYPKDVAFLTNLSGECKKSSELMRA
jgi:stress-induced-phosphoprotein 1